MKRIFALFIICLMPAAALAQFPDTLAASFSNLIFPATTSNEYALSAGELYSALKTFAFFYRPTNEALKPALAAMRPFAGLSNVPLCSLTNERSEAQAAIQRLLASYSPTSWRPINEAIAKYTNDFPLCADIRYLLGYYYYYNNDTVKALNNFRLAVFLSDAHPDAYYYMGRLYNDQFRDFESAQFCYAQYIESEDRAFRRETVQSNRPLITLMSAMIAGEQFLTAHDYSNARLQFSQILTTKPFSVSARIGLGRAYLGENNLQAAQSEFTKAVQIQSVGVAADAAPYYYLAYYYALRNDTNAAITLLLQSKSNFTQAWIDHITGEAAFMNVQADPRWQQFIGAN